MLTPVYKAGALTNTSYPGSVALPQAYSKCVRVFEIHDHMLTHANACNCYFGFMQSGSSAFGLFTFVEILYVSRIGSG